MKHATDYLTFETPHRRDYLNITDRVEAFVGESGIQHGLVLVNPMHITAAVFVNDAESGLIAFEVADPRAVETSTHLIANATSLGGVHSTMESRHRWEGDRIPEGLLRLSVGLEDVEELWLDLEEALS